MDHLKDHIKQNMEVKNTKAKECAKKFKHLLNLDILNDDLSIATMTIVCKFNAQFNIENISKYLELKRSAIAHISYDEDGENKVRTLLNKKSKKKTKVKKKSFFNQATVLVKSNYDDKYVNTKLFKNGSIQMTGCKSIEGTIDVLNTICNELKIRKGIIDPITTNKIIMKPFVKDAEFLSIDNVYDFKISMINCGLNIGFQVDRLALYAYLMETGVEAICDLDRHACVNIKYNYNGDGRRKISIFVFASGSIIITGATNAKHIADAYDYISTLLINNYKKVVFINNLDNMEKNDIRKFLN